MINFSYAKFFSLSQLSNKWNRNKDEYYSSEVGDGLQDFIENCLSSELFGYLKATEVHEQIEKTQNKYKKEARRRGRRADFVISINSKILIPVEVEKTGNIKAGLEQIKNYKQDWNTKYGLLTDGEYWCFYIDNHICQTFNINTLLNKVDEFKLFWKQYTEYENYYILALKHKTKQGLFQEPSDIRTNEDLFFDKTTFLITTIANNISVEVPNIKQVREIAYSYLIQFILIKVLVDNKIEPFLTKYNNDQNKKMSNEMHKVLINLWSDNKKVSDYPPYDFKNALSEENELFAGIKANDSKDLINFLLERFHQEMNISKKHSAPEENVNQTDEEQVYKSFMKEYFSNNIQ